MTGSTNVQNESVQKLDILSNEIMINLLVSCGKTAVLVSEENESAIFVNGFHTNKLLFICLDVNGKGKGGYCVVFDPLDGSSNIDCGVSIGTIFGIYKTQEGSTGSLKDVLRKGSDMVAAGINELCLLIRKVIVCMEVQLCWY